MMNCRTQQLGWMHNTQHVIFAVVMSLLFASTVQAVTIQDIARLKGSETNTLTGLGLVVGLSGTGDSEFGPTQRALREVIRRYVDPNVLAFELSEVNNVALVMVTAEVPAVGVSEGDRVDVKVSVLGNASGLRGGRLLPTPLVEPMRPGLAEQRVFAVASGDILLQDEENETAGKVELGAQMTKPIYSQLMNQFGEITLIINEVYAGWPVSRNIAQAINGVLSPEGPDFARSIDAKHVVVAIPAWEQENPSNFVSQVMGLFVDPDQLYNGARVYINEKTETIVISGDVQVAPILISHGNLTITRLTPEPEPNPAQPIARDERFVSFDPENRGAARLKDLQLAFNQLEVSTKDQIAIIKAMHRQGSLFARLEVE